jgi:homoserine kinase
MDWRSALDHNPSPFTNARMVDSVLKLATHRDNISPAIAINGQVTVKSFCFVAADSIGDCSGTMLEVSWELRRLSTGNGPP